MPKSLKQLLDGDELARRFEEHVPDPSKFVDARPLAAITRAYESRVRAERDILEAVRQARALGHPWWLVGSMLHTSGEAARQRYGPLIDQEPSGDRPADG